MSTLRQFIERAKDDRPVYVCDVRDAFQREGTRPFHYHVRLYDDRVRRFVLKLPPCESGEESRFLTDYLNAMLYNALSTLGAKAVDVYVPFDDPPLAAYANALAQTFQVDLPLSQRSGRGRCLNVNQRTLNALCGPGSRFRFNVADIAAEPPIADPVQTAAGSPVFARLPACAANGRLMGMDIGGTDVKLAASLNGRLCAFKEYDWNPAACALADELIEPLRLLTRLMRAAVSMAAEGLEAELPARAFDRRASDAEIRAAVGEMESRLGDRLVNFDGIGLCFPDVVIRDRVIGGESPKTCGMRTNPHADYEAEFAKITGLCDTLRAYVREGGAVMNANDGPMAAFTTAVEQAAAGRTLENGFFAHTLGTDLGTGWILPDGSIPEIPLEIYNCVIDIGSYGQRRFPADDVRSIGNANTGQYGTLSRYTCQSGVFRLAAKYLPEADPGLWMDAMDRGLFAMNGDVLQVPVSPADMRKPCLEYLMRAAEDRGSRTAEIFREIGEALGVVWRETRFMLEPACAERTLFGRLVKTPTCFELLREGARRIVPGIALEAADGTLANTPLMRQLAAHPDYSVAQFGQAVGAIHYACAGMR